MARDYKNRSSRKNEAGGRLAGLLTFVAGVVTGLCLVVILCLTGGVPALNQAVETTRPRLASPADEEQIPAKQTQDKTGKAVKQDESPNRPTPKFDFYTILPEMEVSVPQWESETETAPPEHREKTEQQAAVSEEERYILQIGSFRDPDEAERVKAKLALLGINTEIQRVVIDGGDIWHRVRAGPYQSTAMLNQMRQRLIENNIDFMLLKLKQDNG